jgi:demethylmenaquinone methyltransferase/2-methoxy-6-polyprenyl-1,4-benzoquinol methylase
VSQAVRRIFCDVPRTYEVVNHVLTLGMDILWRRRAARIAARGGGGRWLDMCTGTGETAVYLSRAAPEETTIYACDFCMPMVRPLATRVKGRPIALVLGDAGRLPFCDGVFDLVTMSFATRNLTVNREILLGCFREYVRILKPGGRFVNLETSQPRSRIIRKLFHLYVGITVRPLGTFVSGSRAAYGYLSHTIPRFCGPEALASLLRQAGFERVTWTPLLLGAAAIHEAEKGAED